MSQFNHKSTFYAGATRYGGSAAIAKRREAAKRAFFQVDRMTSSLSANSASKSSKTEQFPTIASRQTLNQDNLSNKTMNLVHSYAIKTDDIIRKESAEPHLTSSAKRILNWIEENSTSSHGANSLELNKRRRTKHRFNPMPCLPSSSRVTSSLAESRREHVHVEPSWPNPSLISKVANPNSSVAVTHTNSVVPTISTTAKILPLVKQVNNILPPIQPPSSKRFKSVQYIGPRTEITIKTKGTKRTFKQPISTLAATKPKVSSPPKKSSPASTVPVKSPITPTKSITWSSPIASTVVNTIPKSTVNSPVTTANTTRATMTTPTNTTNAVTSAPLFSLTKPTPIFSTPAKKLPLVSQITNILPPIEPPSSRRFKLVEYIGPKTEIRVTTCGTKRTFKEPVSFLVATKPKIFSPPKQSLSESTISAKATVTPVTSAPLPSFVTSVPTTTTKTESTSTVTLTTSATVTEPTNSTTTVTSTPLFSFTKDTGTNEIEMDIDMPTTAFVAPVQPPQVPTSGSLGSNALTPIQTSQVPTPVSLGTSSTAVTPATSLPQTIISTNSQVFGPNILNNTNNVIPSSTINTFIPTVPSLPTMPQAAAPVGLMTMPNGSNPFQPAASSVRGRKILRPTRRLHR